MDVFKEKVSNMSQFCDSEAICFNQQDEDGEPALQQTLGYNIDKIEKSKRKKLHQSVDIDRMSFGGTKKEKQTVLMESIQTNEGSLREVKYVKKG